MQARLKGLSAILEFVSKDFLKGKEVIQASNFKRLVNHMIKNEIPFEISERECEELLDNDEVALMVSTLLKSKDKSVYLENPLFYSLASVYASRVGLSIGYDDEEDDRDYLLEVSDDMSSFDDISKLVRAHKSEDEEIDETRGLMEISKNPYGVDYIDPDLYNAYLKDVKNEEYTPEEEKEVFKRYAEGEKYLLDEIADHYLKYVITIAKRYVGKGIDLIDLIQDGNVGLKIAIDKYNYRAGTKFTTFATWWIRQVITRDLSNNSRTIRVPVYLTELIPRIAIFIRGYVNEFNGQIPDYETIAAGTGIREVIVRRILESSKPISLDEPVFVDGQEEGTLSDFIEDESIVSPDTEAYYEEFRNLVFKSDILTPREAKVIKYRYGFIDGHVYTQEEVGREFKVTRERIRQIEERAIKKLRMNKRVRAFGKQDYGIDRYSYALIRHQ